jgi:hypothetical protein
MGSFKTTKIRSYRYCNTVDNGMDVESGKAAYPAMMHIAHGREMCILCW